MTPIGSTTFRTRASPYPTTTRISVAPAPLTASVTFLIIGTPATGCRTFGKGDFIRVPLPAARIITESSGAAVADSDDLGIGPFQFFDHHISYRALDRGSRLPY